MLIRGRNRRRGRCRTSILVSDYRHRAPLEPFLILLASVGAVADGARSHRHRREHEHERFHRQRLARFTEQRHVNTSRRPAAAGVKSAASAKRRRRTARRCRRRRSPAGSTCSSQIAANDEHRRVVDVGIANRNVGRPQDERVAPSRAARPARHVAADVRDRGVASIPGRRRRAPRAFHRDRSVSPRSFGCRATRERRSACRRAPCRALGGDRADARVELLAADVLLGGCVRSVVRAAGPAALPRSLPQAAADAAGGRQREAARDRHSCR